LTQSVVVSSVRKVPGTQLRLPLGNGFLFLCSDNIRVDLEEEPHIYDLEVEIIEGRLSVSKLCVSRRPGREAVTAEHLKSLPLVRLAATAGEGVFSGLCRLEPTKKPGITRIRPAKRDDIMRLPDVEQAALIYRVAYFLGFPPTATVAKELGISPAVAAKRVQAARRERLLNPTTRGKKGS
jgi:hypothetical protein